MSQSFFSYQKTRAWLWRWHRRTGLAAVIVLIIVTITGVFLNHTSELSLSKKHVNQEWLLAHYGISRAELTTFKVGDDFISGDDKHQLYLNAQPLAQCRGVLVGVGFVDGGFVTACEKELLLFDERGELLEKLSAVYGLPVPLKQLGVCDEFICMRTEQRVFKLDIEQLAFKPLLNSNTQWSQPTQLSEATTQSINTYYQGQGLDWERVLLDLHSGRLFGSLGVWVFDAAAILLLFLALSGFALWYQQVLKKRSR